AGKWSVPRLADVARRGNAATSQIRFAKTTSNPPPAAASLGHPKRLPCMGRLDIQFFQIFAEGPAEIRALEGKFYRGFQKPKLVARVVALAFINIRIHLFLLQQHAHTVSQLQFSAGAGWSLGETIENSWSQDIPPDNGEVRRRLFRLRLLHHVANFEQATVESIGRLRIEYAVGRNHLPFDHLRRDHAALLLVEHIHHLLERGHGTVNHVIREQHREGLVAYKFASHQHRVTQSQRLLLANISH